MSLGVSFSIEANLGVSPVSSLAYAITLSAGLSIGITTILSNVLYVIVQIILSLEFGKAKVTSDGMNVVLSAAICLIFILSLGSVGIETIIAALSIVRIISWMKTYAYQSLNMWIYGQKSSENETTFAK